MIGLDANIILRDLLQDDQRQTRQANHAIDRQVSDENPGFISLVTVLEIVWVLRSLFKRTPASNCSPSGAASRGRHLEGAKRATGVRGRLCSQRGT